MKKVAKAGSERPSRVAWKNGAPVSWQKSTTASLSALVAARHDMKPSAGSVCDSTRPNVGAAGSIAPLTGGPSSCSRMATARSASQA